MCLRVYMCLSCVSINQGTLARLYEAGAVLVLLLGMEGARVRALSSISLSSLSFHSLCVLSLCRVPTQSRTPYPRAR